MVKRKAKMKLSILICTVPSRIDDFFPSILKKLDKQAELKDVEILYLGDNKKRTVGQKRNDLLALAQGKYVVFVDDDDDITDDYVAEILNGTNSDADVINFHVMCSVNGGEYRRVDYDASFTRNSNKPTHYERQPNHIMCIKKELAIKAGFPKKNVGEDDEFAKRLSRLLKTQAFIEKTLYYYNFSHQTSETQ